MFISELIFGICALIMIGIGISQIRSKEPVGFYAGEKGPSMEEITDVQAWNKRHGVMWLIYGVVIIISWIVGYLIGDSPLCLIPFCIGLLAPVIIMIWYHHRLIKIYKKK